MTYEELLVEADNAGLIVKEKPLQMNDGRIKGKRIAIRRDIRTNRQKGEVLLEELEHAYSTCGNILDQSVPLNRMQELRARRRAYKRQVTLPAIIEAYEAGCTTLYEVSEQLDISEQFLTRALAYYAGKYGPAPARWGQYLVFFAPALRVMKLLEGPAPVKTKNELLCAVTHKAARR